MPQSDVLVVGGGHNGLVAAVLAAQAGRQVTVLERSAEVGGATVSAAVFAGRPARLSRYSYLVSLFPTELVARLGIELPLAPRSVASYTPTRRHGAATGLLVESNPGSATEQSFRNVTGSIADFHAWQRWSAEVGAVARVLAPALLGPLRSRAELRSAVIAAAGPQIWTDLFEVPIGVAIERRFGDDLVRGVIATDALIGTFASLYDESLLANRCLLYHVIGRGTGEWSVPVGGMGALTAALVRRATELGVAVVADTAVMSAAEDSTGVTLLTTGSAGDVEWRASTVLAAVAPTTVAGWRGGESRRPVGSQLKVNMLLSRLPRLASGVDPAMAFAGTMHLEEAFDALETAYRQAAAGSVPNPLPAEVYCHSLTDPSILGGGGGASLTLFGLHTPVGLFDTDPERAKTAATDAALASLQTHLAEPLRDCLQLDAQGRPCIDVATPGDLVETLAMPGGHIFHGDLSWPWLEVTDPIATAGDRYGVAVPESRRILLAGAGSRRGGGVSGLGGAAAVDALLSEPPT